MVRFHSGSPFVDLKLDHLMNGKPALNTVNEKTAGVLQFGNAVPEQPPMHGRKGERRV